ncbi:hypothetical protein OKW21_001437 [Catalinimonas alkaloidigena]|uniref:hypothetical protein n=1 Tax=Catalinimonas alkaloidigena TaxID=1075417 RepID=UPI00240513E9|nr:hypothetical protein [Catalinimonas alkaloidigena]MDF9796174.1 hypothetical protein [Catalinimonas alkaloidigena]
MKDFIYSDKFDNYLKGKLSKNEKIAIEDDIHQDPLLRSEVKLQQDIYKSLGEARRSYLKSRLDQVTLHTNVWYEFTGIQFAAVLTSLIFLTGGGYYLYQYSKEVEPEISLVEIEVPKQNSLIPSGNISPDLPIVDFRDEEPDEHTLSASSENDFIQPEVEDLNESNEKSEIALTEDKADVELPNLVRPEVLNSFNDESQNIDYEDFEAPDKTLLQATEYSNADVEIETLLDSKYNFHYQLYNNKLYLHGNFEGVPYRVIALNQEEKKKKLFLNYNGAFYKLKLDQKEVALLEAIQDSTVIKALTKISK